MTDQPDPMISKVAELFSIRDYTVGNDVAISGRSGAKHKFDLVLESKSGQRTRLAVLDGISENLIKDIMVFNAYAEDCGIEVKAISVDRDLEDPEIHLLNTYHISVIDKRSEKIIKLRPIIFGISGFDRIINGAMRRGNIYMVSGKTGVGKTVLGLHFLVQGARQGEKGAVILTNQKRDTYIANAMQFSIEFDRFYKEGLIEVIELSERIRQLRRVLFEHKGNYGKYAKKLGKDIRDAVQGSKIQRLVIDPITPVIVENEDLINLMFNSLVVPQAMTLITSGARKSELSAYGIEEYYVSGIIKLESTDEMNRVMKATIPKMAGGFYEPFPFYYKITEDGIVNATPADSLKVFDSSDVPILKKIRANPDEDIIR